MCAVLVAYRLTGNTVCSCELNVFNKSSYQSKPCVWSKHMTGLKNEINWTESNGTNIIANNSRHGKYDSCHTGTAGKSTYGND
jgi:hypothetical protein